MVHDAFDQIGVAVHRNALMLGVVVIVVVVEANRHARGNIGRQFGRLASPLIFCVAFEKHFIQVLANEASGLLFELRQFRLRKISFLKCRLKWRPKRVR